MRQSEICMLKPAIHKSRALPHDGMKLSWWLLCHRLNFSGPCGCDKNVDTDKNWNKETGNSELQRADYCTIYISLAKFTPYGRNFCRQLNSLSSNCPLEKLGRGKVGCTYLNPRSQTLWSGSATMQHRRRQKVWQTNRQTDEQTFPS